MKILLLNSGGLDSALVAYKLKKDGHEVGSLHIKYSNMADRPEAEETAKRYCTEHIVHEQFIPEARVEIDSTKNSFNVLQCLTVGMVYAKRYGYDLVVGGFKGNVVKGFTEHFNKLNDFNTLNRTRTMIECPLEGMMHYDEVLKWAEADVKDFAYTYSCECGDLGTCTKCYERKELEI